MSARIRSLPLALLALLLLPPLAYADMTVFWVYTRTGAEYATYVLYSFIATVAVESVIALAYVFVRKLPNNQKVKILLSVLIANTVSVPFLWFVAPILIAFMGPLSPFLALAIAAWLVSKSLPKEGLGALAKRLARSRVFWLVMLLLLAALLQTTRSPYWLTMFAIPLFPEVVIIWLEARIIRYLNRGAFTSESALVLSTLLNLASFLGGFLFLVVK